MKKLILIVIMLTFAACDYSTDPLVPSDPTAPVKSLQKGTSVIAEGDVEIVWKGGNGKGNGSTDMRAFASFFVREATLDKPAKGEFCYKVTTRDRKAHREINVEIDWVSVEDKFAWFSGKVISDEKSCDCGDYGGSDNGGSSGGHDDGCSGEDGCGCSGGDNGGSPGGHDDGGSSGGHDDGGSCGGNGGSGGGNGGGSGGGCSEGGDAHDGGCSHDDGGGCGNSGGGNQGGNSQNPKGKYSRVGQYIFVKVHDVGSSGDGITWKWFKSSSPNLPDINSKESWHLCKKTIIKGDIKIKTVYCAYAGFVATPIAGLAPLKVQFQNHSGGSVWKYNWEYGDGISEFFKHDFKDMVHPFHEYLEPGVYSPTLTASGDGGTAVLSIPNMIYADESYDYLNMVVVDSGATYEEKPWKWVIDHDVVNVVGAVPDDAWVTLKFTDSTEKLIHKIRILVWPFDRSDNYGADQLKKYSIWASQDGIDFGTDPAFVGFSDSIKGEWDHIELEEPINAKYIKLVLNSPRKDGAKYINITEFQLFGE